MSERSNNILKHIGITALTRPLSMFLSFIQIRFMVTYLGNEKYGIWATLLSIMSWISCCDMGIGNGLRNKLGEAFSSGNKESAKEYIATSYFVIFIISLSLFMIGFTISLFLDWQKIFNSLVFNKIDYVFIICLNLFFVCMNFISAICNQIFYAHQDAAKVSFNQLTSQILFLPLLILLMRKNDSNLILLSISYGGTIFISNICWTMAFFCKQKDFRCGLRYIKRKRISDVMGLGGRFFVMQISSIVIFTTDNLLISQLFGPSEVTAYDVVYKLFSLISIGHNIILLPLWSGFTDAYVKFDIKWIIKTLKRLIFFQFIVIFGCILFAVLSQWIIKLWIGKEILIPKHLILFMAVYMMINTWNGIFSTFLNGIGEINLSMFICIIQGIINIPLSIYLAKYFGISGIILGTIFTLLISAVASSLQTFFILIRKEKLNEIK